MDMGKTPKNHGMAAKMPPHNEPVRMKRDASPGKSAYGSAMPPNTTDQWGSGTNRANRSPGSGKSGYGASVLPPNSGPGHGARTDTAKIKHGHNKYGA